VNQPAEHQSCWDFVVELYAKPGVSQACLELQDRLGVDVSFLLTILFYAKHHGIDFSVEQIASLDRSISAWRDEVIVPLRRLRRRVKGADLLNFPTEEFYRRIKADELQAEQIEINAVARQLEQISGKQPMPALRRDMVEHVVKHFADATRQHDHLTDDSVQRAISILHSSAN
jgi:uncharacterized protein (TIGR02444 family)